MVYKTRTVSSLYGADGTISNNKFWNPLNIKEYQGPDPEPIKMFRSDGSKISGYVPFILRPFDSVSLPKDIRRGSSDFACPTGYAGSNAQTWCSEKDAMSFHAMTPIIQPNKYNDILQDLFNVVVFQDSGIINMSFEQKQSVRDNEPKYSAIFCSVTKENIMKHIMAGVAIAVSKLPEFQKNGSWSVEQFHWTDADIYNYVSEKGLIYNVIFNLYNPIRSISTLVQCNIIIGPQTNDNKNGLYITYMGLVSQLDWSSSGPTVDDISGYNLSSSNKIGQIHMPTGSGPGLSDSGPEATTVEWNYGNTLLKNEFNKYGFYEEGTNVKVTADMSDTLKNRIRKFENNSNSYLLGAGTVGLTGTRDISNPDGFSVGSGRKVMKPDGIPRTVYSDPQVIYNVPTQLYNNGHGLTQIPQKIPKAYPIGFVNT